MNLLNTTELLDPLVGAQYLLGCVLQRTLEDGTILTAKIVETESYHQEDPASHTFHGRSKRNSAMFGKPGAAYIYFTYGMHWCFNVTAGKEGYGAGILIRAAEPLEGIDVMIRNRNMQNSSNLTNGPAKLAQALAIDKSLYGHDLTKPPLQIFKSAQKDFKIVLTTRIGISKAVDEVARFYINGNPYVSRR